MRIYYLFFITLLLTVQPTSAQNDTLVGVLLDVNNKIIKNHPVRLGNIPFVTVKTNKHGVFIFPNANLQETLYIGDKKGKNPIAIAVNGYSFLTVKSQKGNFNTNFLSEPDMQLLRYLQLTERDNMAARKNPNMLTAEDIVLSGCTDIECLLNALPGVSVSGSRQVSIAGINSSIRGSTSPLFIIDGIPSGDSIVDIPVEDIENIAVQKDGSLYGARGANGLIVINLKRMR